MVNARWGVAWTLFGRGAGAPLGWWGAEVALRAEHLDVVATPPRICVAGGPVPPALVRTLGARSLEVTVAFADVRAIDEAALLGADVILATCRPGDLQDPAFGQRLRVLSRMRPVIVVMSRPDADAVVSVLELGLAGLVAHEVTLPAFERTVRSALRGEIAIPRGLVAETLRDIVVRAPAGDLSRLTPRQRQIVELIARGARDADVAKLLGISPATAHKHVQNARRRMNAKTRSQLVAGMAGLQ